MVFLFVWVKSKGGEVMGRGRLQEAERGPPGGGCDPERPGFYVLWTWVDGGVEDEFKRECFRVAGEDKGFRG